MQKDYCTMNRVFIIAEAGVNHNGSLKMALELIDVAADVGADAVKFQTFKPEAVISNAAPKAQYQIANTGTSESQLDMVRKLALSEAEHAELLAHCRERGIRFLSTPFDPGSARFLVEELHVPMLKVPSGELTNAPFLLQLSRYGLPLIVSTGMCTLGEVEMALGVLAYGLTGRDAPPSPQAFLDAYASADGQARLRELVSVLHCTTEYPAPFDQINLRAMDTLRAAFGLPTGYSDHSRGIAIPIAAVARGAVIIEKHFTLSRELPGPDHIASLEPAELKAMVESIRQVELALGIASKIPAQAEWANRTIARRSLVAARPVKKGELWSTENLACKRPGNGVPPLNYWEYLGQAADKDYVADEMLL